MRQIYVKYILWRVIFIHENIFLIYLWYFLKSYFMIDKIYLYIVL